MRGRKNRQGAMFYAFNIEQKVRADHPLRPIKKLALAELERLNDRFNAAYSRFGRPSIPPETLIMATLLQSLYSIRSERQLCEEIELNMLYRWFLDLKPDDPVFDHSTFTKNRDRFHEHGLMHAFFDGTVARAIQEEATSDDHFSVDGTLIQSMASMKSFRPTDEDHNDPPKSDGPGTKDSSASTARDGNGWADFKGTKRGNKTHRCRTDPEARLYRKGRGREAKLCHMAHALMENRNGLLMALDISEANGHEERNATIRMLKHVRKRHRKRPSTIGQDAGYKGKEHAKELEKLNVTQHIAGHKGRKPKGWTASQRVRKRVESIYGWIKEIAKMDRSRFAGRWKIELQLLAAGASYNLLRLANLGAS
jgi:transposase